VFDEEPREIATVSEPLNTAQIILADGIAERVAAALREDAAAAPLKMFQAELMRAIAKAVVENPPLKVLIDQASIGHNGGPAMDDETSGVMTVPEFCIWARVSRSTVYEMWEVGTGPRFFKAGTAVRITRRAAKEWLIAREAAAAAETAA
jgi:predicted DNA-binding transcriptional regulator AlpA